MASLYPQLQAERVAQLRALPATRREELVRRLQTPVRLPRLELHFRQHGEDFEAATPADYQDRFEAHLRRPNLRWFTFIRPREGDAVWYLLDEASGAVAMYNESRGRYWSFFRAANPRRLLAEVRGWWVELVRGTGEWEPQPW